MSVKVLVDTCVWLDVAKDYRSRPAIASLTELVSTEAVELVVPQTVVDEFDRNKERVTEEARRSLRSHFRIAREAVREFAQAADRDAAMSALHEVDHQIATESETVVDSMAQVEALIRAEPPFPISDEVKRRVTERALGSLAPYHRDKNSVGDAVLIEIYADLASAAARCASDACAFVTHNFRDFSDPHGDRRNPHPDLTPLFEAGGSSYWLSLVELIKSLDPDLHADHDWEFNYGQQSRRLSEILEAERRLFRQVWYNRHWNLRSQIDAGEVQIVAEQDYSRSPHRQDQILESAWASALAAAKRTEEEVGRDNLGPWDDFEWGMLNGKLSALRWVIGEEWDMLDT